MLCRCQFPAAVLVFFALCRALQAEPVEIMTGNRGFEEVKDGLPERFHVSGGRLTSSPERTSGKFGAEYVTEKGRPLNFFASRWDNPTPVRCGDVYTFSFSAKGSGSVGYLIPQYSGNMFRKSLFGPYEELTPEWKRYSFKIRIERKDINNILPGVSVSSGGHAFLDDLSVTYDPADNGGRLLPVEEAPEITTLPVKMACRNARGVLRINGKSVSSVELKEGFNVLEVELTPSGDNPSFRMEAPAGLEALRRGWKEAPAGFGADCSSPEFDDSAWETARTDASGEIVSRRGGRTRFRSVVLWNRDYFGKESMLNRKQKEWLLPAGSIQPLLLKLGPSPFIRPCKTLYLELWLPDGVTLMDLKQEKPRYVLNQEPDRVESKGRCQVAGKTYAKYVLQWEREKLKPWGSNGQEPQSVIPLKVSAAVTPETEASILFGRVVPGDFVEIPKRIPVKFFPPVRGKQPKRLRLQTYAPVPLFALSALPFEVLDALILQEKKIGVNQALGAVYMKGWETYTRRLIENCDRAGIDRFAWPPHNFPLHSMYLGSGAPRDCGFAQLAADPAKQAVYFPAGPQTEWGADPWNGAMYCPSRMLDTPEGKAFFASMAEKGFRHSISLQPGVKGIFLDWEQEIWLSRNRIPGKGSYCFCERCRSAFQKEWKLSRLPSAKEIHEKFLQQWETFRSNQDRRLNAVIHDVCRKMGLKLMFYTQTQMKSYYTHDGGAFDYLFLGHPSGNAINSGNQKEQDDFAAKLPGKRMIAQVFPGVTSRGAAQDGNPDGFVVPSRWKGILLRLFATYRTGADICTPTDHIGGVGYYIGEAMRAVADFEDFFLSGKRSDRSDAVRGIRYPNLLVLEKNGKKLLLLFNESEKDLEISVCPGSGETAKAYYSGRIFPGGKNAALRIPPENAEILLMEQK